MTVSLLGQSNPRVSGRCVTTGARRPQARREVGFGEITVPFATAQPEVQGAQAGRRADGIDAN